MASYPTIAAGQRITPALLAAMVPLEIRKQGNTDRVTNSVVDDDDLQVTLEANAVYFVEFFLVCGATTTADIQTNWTIPTLATGLKSVIGPGTASNDGGADNIAMRGGTHNPTVAIAYSGVRNSTSNLFRVYEHGEITTVTAGTLALRWGQVTTNATAARMGSTSFMRIKRIG